MRKSGAACNHHYLSNTAKCTDRQHLISKWLLLSSTQLQIWNQFTTCFVVTYSFRAAQNNNNTLTAQNQHDMSNTEHNIVSDNTKYQHCSLQASQNYQR